MRIHVKYLPGCLAQRRPLINESSDLTIIRYVTLGWALFCQAWHGDDGRSRMYSSQWRWVDTAWVGVRFLSCLETYVESHFTNSYVFLA